MFVMAAKHRNTRKRRKTIINIAVSWLCLQFTPVAGSIHMLG